MNLIKIWILSASLLAGVCAQAQNHTTQIKVHAMNMANAFMKNDFTVFSRYMHPDIIAYAGGKEKMKAKMDSAYGMMQQFNVRFKRYWIGTPSRVIRYKKELQSVIPQSTTMITPMGELTAESSMIVISRDNGRTWWFIDTMAYNAQKLKTILPDISPDLVIPPRKKPKMVPLQEHE